MRDEERVLMSEQPHVEINKAEWPVVLMHFMKDAHVTVRQNGNRRLVYGTIQEGTMKLYAGFMVQRDDQVQLENETIRAVRRVCGRLGLTQRTTDKIVGELPAIKL